MLPVEQEVELAQDAKAKLRKMFEGANLNGPDAAEQFLDLLVKANVATPERAPSIQNFAYAD